MCQVKLIRTEHRLVTIPVEDALYCECCRTVSNCSRQRCGACGSECTTRLAKLIDGPPPDPDSDPARAALAAPGRRLELLRAA